MQEYHLISSAPALAGNYPFFSMRMEAAYNKDVIIKELAIFGSTLACAIGLYSKPTDPTGAISNTSIYGSKIVATATDADLYTWSGIHTAAQTDITFMAGFTLAAGVWVPIISHDEKPLVIPNGQGIALISSVNNHDISMSMVWSEVPTS